jgi:hypothetical protein
LSKEGLLFVNKKTARRGTQKTVYSLGASASLLPKPPANKRFLLLFFKKEALVFPCLAAQP